MNEIRASGCTGKVRFDSYGAANRVQRRRARDRQYAKGQVYRCKSCQGWHIGVGERLERRRRQWKRFLDRDEAAE